MKTIIAIAFCYYLATPLVDSGVGLGVDSEVDLGVDSEEDLDVDSEVGLGVDSEVDLDVDSGVGLGVDSGVGLVVDLKVASRIEVLYMRPCNKFSLCSQEFRSRSPHPWASPLPLPSAVDRRSPRYHVFL